MVEDTSIVYSHFQLYICNTDNALLKWLVLVLGLVLHHHLPALAHSEGEGALDVLRIAQLVHVLPENLGQVWRDFLVERDFHQLQAENEVVKLENRNGKEKRHLREGGELMSTWKVQDRSWSPSWTNWSMGKETEILFSLVREAMGNERVTTCSPTAGPREG